MVATVDQIRSVGPRYSCGIDSPTSGWMAFFIKPGTFRRQQQLVKRQEVVAALSQAIADRDIDFWTRVSQFDWSKGQNQELFADPSRYSDSRGIDVHKLGAISLVPATTQLAGAAVQNRGRGAALAITVFPTGNAAIFFPWQDGQYAFSTDSGVTWQTSTMPANARIADIETDGNTVFFALYNSGGVWQTNAGAPGALVQRDTGANRYSRLVWDPLRKNLYGIVAADQGAALHKINVGAGPTVVYDWLVGRLDGLELYQGNVVVSWNTASASRGAGPSRIYSYDGTVVSRLADMPDGTFVTALRSFLGYLFIAAFESDPFMPGTDQGGLYFMLGSSGPTRVDKIDASFLDDLTTGCVLGFPTFMFGQGTQLFVCTFGRLTRYDIVNGGVSRSFGDDGLGGAGLWILGAVAVRGAIFAIVGEVGVNATAVTRLNPAGAGGLISASGNLGQRLTSSRFDLGLPYVDKYWYAFEVVCDALIAGQQVLMEYSLDDGATWTACSNSPLVTVGTRRFNFLVQQVNAHIRYRVTLISGAGVASPVVHSIAARFAPSNPNAKVWSFVVTAYDTIRGRGNIVEDSYGKDMIAFLEAIAKQSETVTYYDLNDSAHTPHTVWVLQAETDVQDAANTYTPLRAEGDVPVVLWEVT